MGIDTFLDMGRCATNVVGNSVATAVSPSGRASCAGATPSQGATHGRSAADRGSGRPVQAARGAGRLRPLVGARLSCGGAGGRWRSPRKPIRATSASTTSRHPQSTTAPVELGFRETSIPSFLFVPQPRSATASSVQVLVDGRDRRTRSTATISIDYVEGDVGRPARGGRAANQIDLECGSTTDKLERRKQVEFSPMMFVAGTKLMVPASTVMARLPRPRRARRWS